MSREHKQSRTISSRQLLLGGLILAGSLGLAWAGYKSGDALPGYNNSAGEGGKYHHDRRDYGWDEHEENERHEHEERHGRYRYPEDGMRLRAGATPDPGQAMYAQECGSCHVPYPAYFLPGQSWQKILATLDNHFGDNAELEPKVAGEISAWLAEHAGGRYAAGLGQRQEPVPIRLTQTSRFRKKHDELPTNLVGEGRPVSSWSQCQQCHTRAEEGRYSEHEVVVPGLGRWDD